MIYITKEYNLVNNDYITINRGDIIIGCDFSFPTIGILRIVKNERDF